MTTVLTWAFTPVLLVYLITSWAAPRFCCAAGQVPGTYKRHLLWLVPCGFILLTVGFKIYDPYNTLFFNTAWLPHFAHLVARVLFCIYLLLILFGIGRLALILIQQSSLLFELAPSEEIAISVLLGSSILRATMFFIGFLSAYSWPVLLALGIAALIVGMPRLAFLMRNSLMSFMRNWNDELSSTEKLIVASIIGALLSAVLAVSLGKFLYPNGTGDYFSHYFPYYKEVVRNGNVWPNDLWYHFYISKGFGDVFFAIVLSDLLGPQAVSQAMFILSLIIVYAMMKRMFDDRISGLAVAAVVAVGFIWTFEIKIGFAYWAEFPKQHVITSVLFMGCVWISWLQLNMRRLQTRGWGIVVISIYSGLVLARPQFLMLIAVFLSLMSAYAWASNRRRCALIYLAVLLVSAGFVGAMLTLNYSITGLAEITPFRTFWRHADQAHFATWVSPFLMLLLDLGSSPDLGSIAMPNLTQFKFLSLIAAVFRFDRAAPVFGLWGIPFLIVVGCGLFLFRSGIKRLPLSEEFWSGIGTLTCMLGASILVFFTVNQIGSLFRLYTFCIFPVVMVALLPFIVVRSVFWETRWVRAVTGLALGAICIAAVPAAVRQIPPQQRSAYSSFAAGASNMKDAYADQNAAWEDGLAIVKVVGPDVPVWSSQVTGQYCVAPGCNLQTFFSYSMGPDWHVIVFDDPAHARAALEKAGLNHFAIDTKEPFFDLLPYSPLFAPDHIQDNLALEWTDGTVYLLTWPSANTRPLPPEFMAAYLKSIQSALTYADFAGLYGSLRDVYVKWKARPQWPIALESGRPRPRGWQ
jgi:hypothetical protein